MQEYEEVFEVLGEASFGNDFNMNQILLDLINGNISDVYEYIKDYILGYLSCNVSEYKKMIIMLIVFGIAGAVCTEIARNFGNAQTAELSSFIIFIIMSGMVLKFFGQAILITKETIGEILTFSNMTIPTYICAVSLTLGTSSAAGANMIYVFGLQLIQYLGLKLMPLLAYLLVFFSLMNEVWGDDKMANLLELIEKISFQALNWILGILSAMGFVQNSICSYVDASKYSFVKKGIGALPVIGDGAEAAIDIMAGSAVLIKNAVGTAIFIGVIMTVIFPMLQIFIIALALKLSAGILGLMGNTRVTGFANKAGTSCLLLFKTGMVSILILFIVLALLISTRRGYV